MLTLVVEGVVSAAVVDGVSAADVVASAVVVGVLVDVSSSVVETRFDDGLVAESDADVGSAAAVPEPVLLTFDEDMVNICLAPFTPEKCLRRDILLAELHREWATITTVMAR